MTKYFGNATFLMAQQTFNIGKCIDSRRQNHSYLPLYLIKKNPASMLNGASRLTKNLSLMLFVFHVSGSPVGCRYNSRILHSIKSFFYAINTMAIKTFRMINNSDVNFLMFLSTQDYLKFIRPYMKKSGSRLLLL